MATDNDHQISKYDRLYGGLHDISLSTKPTTIKNVDLTGRAETFVIETKRHPELGDYVFVEHIDENMSVTRMALPPRVANIIASQRDALTHRSRSLRAKRQVQERMAAGWKPTPPPRKKRARS